MARRPSATEPAAELEPSIGFAYVDALVHRDAERLVSLFDGAVEFRALTPSRNWTADEPDSVVRGIVLGTWFDGVESVSVTRLAGGSVQGRCFVDYELDLVRHGERYRIAQYAYYDVCDHKIVWMRVLCSGYRPYPAPAEAPR